MFITAQTAMASSMHPAWHKEPPMTETTTRNTQLRDVLINRRKDLQTDLQRRIMDRRTDQASEVHDAIERSDADLAVDVEFSLMQLKAETLIRIDNALARIETGDYGLCSGCEKEISESRLRALPFAVRCTACEEKREASQAASRRLAEAPRVARFSESVGS
jgi:DnaK suppressor protein